MNHKYQNSFCDEGQGILHAFSFLYENQKGVVEKCTNALCGEKRFFPTDVPNDVYLSFHIRSALQLTDALFPINYPNFDYSLLH